MKLTNKKVRVEKIQELNVKEVQFLAFVKDGKTFPRKIVSKAYEFGKEYTNTRICRQNKFCLHVVFKNGEFSFIDFDVDLNLKIFDGKIHLFKFGKSEAIHPNIEAFLDTLTYIQDLKGTVEEIDVINKNLIDMEYDLMFAIGYSTIKAMTAEEVTDIYMLIGNIYIRLTQQKYCRARYSIKIGIFYITYLSFNKIHDNNS